MLKKQNIELFVLSGLTTMALMVLVWFAMPDVVSQFVTSTLGYAQMAFGVVAVSLSVIAVAKAVGVVQEVAHQRTLAQLEITAKQAKVVTSGRTIQVLRANERAIITNHLGELSLIEAANSTPLTGLPGGALVDAHGGEPEMPGLIDIMSQHQRMIIIGGSGSGKTNVLKHFVSRLAQHGEKLLIIDPHSPSKLVGCDVVGAGLDFQAIGNKMIDVMLTVNRRYQSGNISQDGNTGNDTWLIIDEMRDINSALGDLSEQFLECMLVRGRKAGYRFIILSQNDTTSSLGLKGDKDLFKACQRIELKRDITTNKRRAFVGWRAVDKVECMVPGLYQDDHVQVSASQLIVDNPPQYSDAEKQLALTVASLNGQAGQISKNEIFKRANVSKNGQLYQFLNTLLEG